MTGKGAPAGVDPVGGLLHHRHAPAVRGADGAAHGRAGVTEYTPNLSAYTNAFAYNDYVIASAEAVIIAVAAFVLSFGFLAWTNRKGRP